MLKGQGDVQSSSLEESQFSIRSKSPTGTNILDLSQLSTDLHTCLEAVLRNLEHVESAYKAVNLYFPGKLHYDFVKHLKINQKLYK